MSAGRPLTTAELEDLTWMAENGENLDGAAHRLGRNPGSLERLLERCGHHDILRPLRRNRPRPARTTTA